MPKGKKSRWEIGAINHGYVEIKLFSWKYFGDFISQVMLNYPDYVYRGHADAIWKLESRFDRETLKQVSSDTHLRDFRMSSRGRRGQNPANMDDDEWWSLGQHMGLISPLLDWTEVPFAALFFAFVEDSALDRPNRAVYGLSPSWVELQSGRMLADHMLKENGWRRANEKPPLEQFMALTGHKDQSKTGANLPPSPQPPCVVRIVRPESNDNSRLVSQRGLFTRVIDGKMPIEDWVVANASPNERKWLLFKIIIPNQGQEECLRMLNRMNINYLSLFPDLYGAAMHCNLKLKLKNY